MDEQKISAGASKAMDIAAGEAARLNCRLLEKEHLLIGILSLEKTLGSLDAETSRSITAEIDAVQNVLEGVCSRPKPMTELRRTIRRSLGGEGKEPGYGTVHRSEECKAIFKRAEELSYSKGEITCLHLLAAILENPGSNVGASLAALGISAPEMAETVSAWIAIIEGGGKAFGSSINKKADVYSAVNSWIGRGKKTGYLEKYGRDLSREAAEGRLGPFAGRKKELLQLIQVLGRRTKNNPVLVGEAGVGKTAIVGALAVRIASGKDFQVLGGKHLIELNMATLRANTKYRGDLEERLTGVLNEALADSNIILFIDEIHSLAGKNDGATMDASDIFKPYLSRGLRCIGASTLTEYHRYVEADPALERRFETILVKEPGREEALAMLESIRPRLEEHHAVHIPDTAMEAAIDLSMRFDADHMLPDKAVSLLDTACSGARISQLSMGSSEEPRKEVDAMVVAETIAAKAGIPLEIVTGHLAGTSTSRLLGLESFIMERLAGQDEAVERICNRLSVAYAGLEKRSGPLAVLLLMGPTGVGKTETAKLLAEFLFGNSSEMIRLDMSEYSEESSVAKLIGSPPGYVGYGDEGQLIRMMRARPYSVVLFDEVEKAHSKVFDVFLQLFDEGRITDSRGRTADARNAIFIMTSNLRPEVGLGYDEVEEGIKKPKKAEKNGLNVFRPEFLNRIDELIVFQPLDINAVRKLLKKTLDETLGELEKKHHVSLRLSEEAETFLARASYSPEYGARELKRSVRQFIYVPLSSLILSDEIKNHRRWLAVYDENGISIVPDE